MNDPRFPRAFDGAAAVASPRPLSDLLEHRLAQEASTPPWLSGAVPGGTAGPVAVSAPEPEPAPAPEPEPAPEPPPPPPPPAPDPAVTQRMLESIDALSQARAELTKEPDLVSLALTVAQEVLHHELTTRPELVVEAVHEGMTALRGELPSRIRVHPTMLEALQAARPDLPADGVELVADPSLEVGGCLVEGEHVALDASIEERLERFKAAFAEALGHEEDA